MCVCACAFFLGTTLVEQIDFVVIKHRVHQLSYMCAQYRYKITFNVRFQALLYSYVCEHKIASECKRLVLEPDFMCIVLICNFRRI